MRALEDLVTVHGRPVAVRVDKGPELLAQSFLECRAPGDDPLHPTGQAGSGRVYRALPSHVSHRGAERTLFESTAELQALTDTWLRTYNRERPHDSLGRKPPLSFFPRPNPDVSPENDGRRKLE